MEYHIEMINGFPIIVYDTGDYSSTSVTPMVVNENNVNKQNNYSYLPVGNISSGY